MMTVMMVMVKMDVMIMVMMTMVTTVLMLRLMAVIMVATLFIKCHNYNQELVGATDRAGDIRPPLNRNSISRLPHGKTMKYLPEGTAAPPYESVAGNQSYFVWSGLVWSGLFLYGLVGALVHWTRTC